MDPLNAIYQGSPSLTARPDGSRTFDFVRRKASPILGIEYRLLESFNLVDWHEAEETDFIVTDLGDDWELVTRSLGNDDSLFLKVELSEVPA